MRQRAARCCPLFVQHAWRRPAHPRYTTRLGSLLGPLVLGPSSGCSACAAAAAFLFIAVGWCVEGFHDTFATRKLYIHTATIITTCCQHLAAITLLHHGVRATSCCTLDGHVLAKH